ncbi:MAG: flagellar filament capping protein FliD [Rhodocyclaceae bacterium]|nr:flagellar filament capping protein FliD [Rhodocyclaceae bacterium]MDZ4215267.1 flagellar filament capping protein FliD [Rhodocyclaceae bacterium]
MAISSPGIGSGLDINGIINKLMSVEAQPLSKLNFQEASYQSKISAFGTLKGAVSSLNTALAGLIPGQSATPAITAKIGNSAAAFVTAESKATTGSYSLEVNQLATPHKIATVAQSQRLASAAYASAFSSINQGTMNLSVGGGASVAITIGPGNATLTGLKNAINSSSADVTADIMRDSNGEYRLTITSNKIGSAGKITTSGLTGFTYNGTTGSLSEDPDDGGRIASGYGSASDSVATGTLSIQIGSNTAKQVVIDNSNNTLLGLKNAINSANAGVTAELVTVSSNNIRLVLTANSMGENATITTSGLAGFDFDGGSGTGSLSQSAINGGQLAKDAIIKLDGVTSNYSSNTITTAINDVTLRLTGTTTTATTVTIARSEGSTLAEQAAAKFRSFKGSVGDSSATASVTASAVQGSYSFQVMQLATTHRISTPGAQAHQITTAAPKAQILRSAAYAGEGADVTDGENDGTLNITVGSMPEFTVDVPAGTTLAELRALINSNAGNTGVTASIVDGQLTLASNTAGAQGKISLTNTGGLTGLDYDATTNTGSLFESQGAQGYSSSADTIATGTLSLTIGNGAATNITIDGSNNTLAGLRDAINSNVSGVTASIVSDGLGMRLVLKSNTAGRDGALTLSGLDGFEFNSTTKTLSDAAADGGLAAQGYASANASVGTGTLKLTLGDGSPRNITIDSSNNTLEGVKNAINSGSYGVTASLVTVSGSDVRLILTSNTIGMDGQISLSGIDGLNFDPGSGAGDFSQSEVDGGQAAQGAIIKINGVAINSNSNTVTGALQGVTLNLTTVSTNQTTLSVSQEKTSSLNATLAAIVKAYNDLNKTVGDLGKYDATTKSGGALLGNSTLRQVSSSVRNALQSSPSGLSSTTIKRLSDIGLEFQKDGSLIFNAGKLSSAANSDYDAVALLAASFGKTAKALTDSMLGTKGSITSASSGLETSIKGLEQRREVMSRRLVQIEARYKRQFSSLDTMIASMNQTSNYLSQQLANISKIGNSRN